MIETKVLGQSKKKGNFDSKLAETINQEVAAKNRQKQLKEKRKKPEPKQEQDLENKVATTSAKQLRKINGKVHLPPGKYKVDFEIEIPKESTLTLSPGVELYLAKGVKIKNYGKLLIKGTEKQKTILTAQKPKEGWQYIENHGYLLIEYAIISHGKGLFGGAIDNRKKADIIDSELTDNQAEWGGVIYNDHNAELNITGESTFKNNHAKICGGAIRNYDGTVNIKGKNEFKNNKAIINGGAISWFGEKPEIDPRTIYDHNTPNNVSEDV